MHILEGKGRSGREVGYGGFQRETCRMAEKLEGGEEVSNLL